MYKFYQYNDNQCRIVITRNNFIPHKKTKKEIDYGFGNTESDICSLSRAKRMIREYSLCNDFIYFFTSTVNSKLADRYSLSECQKNIRKIMKSIKRKNNDFIYLFITEKHKDGAFHFHGLLADVGDMKFVDSGKRTKDKKHIYNMSKWKYGFTTAIKVYDTSGVSKYLAKYITKELCDLTKGKHRYFVSNNLQEPIAELYLMNDMEFSEFLEPYLDLYGKELKHVSKPRVEHAFVNVDYYEAS